MAKNEIKVAAEKGRGIKLAATATDRGAATNGNAASADTVKKYDEGLTGASAPAGTQTKAQTKAQADSMSVDQQLWDSLSYSYGQKKQASDQQYQKAISDQDNALLSRGMQRSSYGMSTLGNLRNEQIKANSQIDSEMIADYENRLQQARKDEQEQANWQATFNENQRQFNEQQAENRRQYDTNLEYQKGRDEVADTQWKQTFDENQRQFNEQQQENQRQFNENLAENQRQYDQSMAENQRQYDTTFGENQRQYDTTFGENQRQYDESLANTKYEFEQTQKADEKNELRSIVTSMIESGVVPSQALLDEVGISYADASSWASKKNTSSSGGSKKTTTGDDEEETEGTTTSDLLDGLNSSSTVLSRMGAKIKSTKKT